MPEWINNADFVFWAAITLMVIVPSVAHYWYKTRKVEIEAELKREMIARGMSADDIGQVLRGRGKHESAVEDQPG